MNKNGKHVVIIGAGMGGLATALRLRFLGFNVTVFEKQPRTGGRSNVIEEKGFRLDIGPTILVMKDTFKEFYQSIGQDIDQRLSFIQLDPNYRIYFHDRTYIDLYSNMAKLAMEVENVEPGGAERLYRFLGANAEKYERGMPFVTRNYDHITDLANPSAAWKLLRTRAHENLYRQVSNFFQTDKLRKAFSFHSMFLGLSPFSALAMYSLITYADMALGMWYPKGGIYSIIEDMLRLANEMGIIIYTNAPVQQVLVENGRAIGVLLNSGKSVRADLVVSNADLPYTYQSLLGSMQRKQYSDRKLRMMNYACSGYLLYLGLDKKYDHLRHQALYFSQDYRANLDAIFVKKTLPKFPSFHLNTPTQTDPSLAPEGHTLLYVLAPMPNLETNIDWEQAAPEVRENLIHQLEWLVDPAIRSHIIWERQFTPMDFKLKYNAMYGTAFGSLSHDFFQSAYFRPHNKDRYISNLYFVGQGTYPGIGMPMVLISSRLTVDRITKEWL
jgi:phytoene desaturase